MILDSGETTRIWDEAAKPSWLGRSVSRRTTVCFSDAANRTASSPSAASPTTSIPTNSLRKFVITSLNGGKSSIKRTVTLNRHTWGRREATFSLTNYVLNVVAREQSTTGGYWHRTQPIVGNDATRGEVAGGDLVR